MNRSMKVKISTTVNTMSLHELNMKKTVVFPGTFDPITWGHVDLIQRATELFDQVIVAITSGSAKSPMFSLAQRVSLIESVFEQNSGIQAQTFSGLLVDFMREHQIKTIIRGIRTLADAEYEFQLANMNRTMSPEVETLFLQTNPLYSHVSSSIVREIVIKSNPQQMESFLARFVPSPVIKACQQIHDR